MALVIVVSRTELNRYMYLKHLYADQGMDVVLDRRLGERRQRVMPPRVERRHMERRAYRDITSELQATGWAVLRHATTYGLGCYDLAPK